MSEELEALQNRVRELEKEVTRLQTSIKLHASTIGEMTNSLTELAGRVDRLVSHTDPSHG